MRRYRPPRNKPDRSEAAFPGVLLRLAAMLFVSGLALAGCNSSATLGKITQPGPSPVQTNSDLPDWHRSELLYLSADGAERVYVQMDCVAGACPTRAERDAMETFLRRHLPVEKRILFDHKPAIDRRMATGRDEIQLALHRMKMPSHLDDGKTAYIYLLFYDSALTGDQSIEADPPRRPYVRVDYPSAVFVDMAYWTQRNRAVLASALKHELGHVLGLTKNDDHGDGSHCKHPLCISYPYLRVPEEGKRPIQQGLCRDCLADLQDYRNRPAPPELSFQGPVLVRKARGYRVASLPGYTRMLIDADKSQPDCREVAIEARRFAATRSGLADKCHCSLDTGKLSLRDENQKQKMLWALLEARRDPDATIADLARKLYSKLLQASER